jgi:MFS family permease
VAPRLRLDLAPLRHRDFRLVFAARGLTFFGSMMSYVAVPYQVYDLTGSTFMVGLLSAVELVVLLVMAVAGGAVADSLDRRKLVQRTEVALCGGAAVLVANSLRDDPSVAVLFVAASAMGGLAAFQRPALEAMTPRLVERHELAAAAALSGALFTFGMIAGPAIAGLLIAADGVELAYAVDLATYVAAAAGFVLVRAVPPPEGAEPPTVRAVVDGFRYARSRQDLIGTYAVDMVAMVFGMPMALFPAIAERYGGPGVVGILYAAPAAGAMVASLTSGWAGRVRRHGQAIIVSALVWGVGIVAFGLAPNLPLAVAALATAGAADMISGLFRMTMWNETIPDQLRGRLASIELISYSSGPLLGNAEAGAVAGLFGVRASVVSGGVLCLVGVVAAAVLLPQFRNYVAEERVEPAAP